MIIYRYLGRYRRGRRCIVRDAREDLIPLSSTSPLFDKRGGGHDQRRKQNRKRKSLRERRCGGKVNR